MDQAITATILRYSPTMALVAVLAANSASVYARAPTERPVGIVDQPCLPPADVEPKASDPSLARLLDPGKGRKVETPGTSDNHPDPAQDERLHHDWAQLCRYRAENAASSRATAPRVVFMGDSITEFWKPAHPEFFGDNYIDRGISGQTTAQMLVRFHQDVIALKPAVVHILGGTNDIAGNGGPTTLDVIKDNIVAMVELATANGIRVILAAVPPAGTFPWRPSIRKPAQHIVELNEWLRRFAREKNLIYVDYHERLADERDAMKQTFSNDGVHPNRDGYSAMEPLARHAIEQALASVASAATTPAAKPPKSQR
jgi:lysophospholipase L1-like esterase